MSEDQEAESGRVLLVTGASSGIGEMVAVLAVRHGFRVGLAARRTENLDALVEKLGPSNAVAVGCDVADFESCRRAVGSVVERFGRLDVLVANAGVGRSVAGWLVEPIEHWQAQVSVNILGTAFSTRAALPAVTASRGHLVLVGSTSVRRPLAGSMYGCTKAAVGAMAEALRLEVAGTGVHVSLVSPGLVDTPMNGDSEVPAWALQPEDVARAIMYVLTQPPHVDVNEVLVRPVAQRS